MTSSAPSSKPFGRVTATWAAYAATGARRIARRRTRSPCKSITCSSGSACPRFSTIVISARAADIGVAGGRGIGLIFKNGEVIRKVPEKDIVQAMREEVDRFIAERKAARVAAPADD